MSNLTYNTGLTTNWSSLWSGNFNAPPVPGDTNEIYKYYPMAPIDVPVLLGSELIAFYASSTDAKETWHYAGSVSQRIQTGIITGGGADAVVSKKRIWLNQVSVLRYPIKYQSTYALTVYVPYWIRSISFICGNTSEQLMTLTLTKWMPFMAICSPLLMVRSMEVILSGLLIVNTHFTWKLLERLAQFNYRLKRLESEVFPDEPEVENEAFG